MKTQITVVVEGGVVQTVLADTPDVDVIVVDYDSENAAEIVEAEHEARERESAGINHVVF